MMLNVSTKGRVFKNGKMLPWFNRNALDKLLTLNIKEWSVFEWGAGQSTLWWQDNVKEMVSIEHNNNFYESLKQKVKNNCIILHRQLIKGKKCNYTNVINDFEDQFDCIIVDGRNRVLCILETIGKLKKNGYIILDNSRRNRYMPGVDLLNDYYNLFYVSPVNLEIQSERWETSIWKNDK